MSIRLIYFWAGLPKVFLLLQTASRKDFSGSLGCRNTAHPKMFSDLVTASPCSYSHGLPASLQNTWLFGSKPGRVLFALGSLCGSLCLGFSPFITGFPLLGTSRKKASVVSTMCSGSRENRAQSWLCHSTLCNYRQVANAL